MMSHYESKYESSDSETMELNIEMNHEDGEDCPICGDDGKIRMVQCGKCGFRSCRDCIKNYLTKTLQSLYPNCMNCKDDWSYEFVGVNTDREWYFGEYLDHRAKILLSREKSRLPEIQEYAVQREEMEQEIKKIEEIYICQKDIIEKKKTLTQDLLCSYKKLFSAKQLPVCQCFKCAGGFCHSCGNGGICIQMILKSLFCSGCGARHCKACVRTLEKEAFLSSNSWGSFKCTKCAKDLTKEIYVCKNATKIPRFVDGVKEYKEILNMKKTHGNLFAQRKRTKDDLLRLRTSVLVIDDDGKKEFKQKFMVRCPYDKCNGFVDVDNEAIKGNIVPCPVCNKRLCRKCHIPVEKDKHTCKKEDLETAKFIRKDTKQCPKCQYNIHKISGCPQMWCTNCHTAFNWDTLEIEKGRIHNPEFYAWMRQQNGGQIPRNAGERGDCDGDITINEVMRTINPGKYESMTADYIYNLHCLLEHIRGVSIRQYAPRERTVRQQMREKSADVILSKITEKEWLQFLKKTAKAEERDSSIRDVLTMFADALAALIGNAAEYAKTDDKKKMEEVISEFEGLRKYVNARFESLGKWYKNKMPSIVYRSINNIPLGWEIVSPKERGKTQFKLRDWK